MATFEDDVDAAAALGWGPDGIDKMAAVGLSTGDFATFQSLEPETRRLVLRLLDNATEEDLADLENHPAGKALAQWLLTLPAYRRTIYDPEA